MERCCQAIENLTVGTSHPASQRVVYEAFVAGALFVPPGLAGTLLFWGGAPDTPSGMTPPVTGQASTYPTNATTGLAGNFAPIIGGSGSQVSLVVNGAGDGAWYPFPAECRPFGQLKLTSSTITAVAVVLKS